MTQKQPDDLRPFKFLGLSLLQWMGIIVVAGIVLTLIIRHYSPS